MNTIITYIQKMFTSSDSPNTYGSELEAFIVSKKPTNAAEVDYWVQEFDRRKAQRSGFFTVGGYNG